MVLNGPLRAAWKVYNCVRGTRMGSIIKLLKVVIRLTARSARVNHDALRRRRQPLRIALHRINCSRAAVATTEARTYPIPNFIIVTNVSPTLMRRFKGV